MFKSNSQWMQHKTTVEFFDSQQEFIAEVAGRYDPEHKQGEYFKMSMEHLENLGGANPQWDGLGYGTQEERYHLGMDLIQSGSQNKNLIANLQNQSTNVKVTTTMNVGSRIKYGTKGSRLSVTRFIAGDPNCFITSEPIQVKGKPFVHVVIDASTLGDISAETVRDRGIIILRKVVELILQGYMVRVSMATNTVYDNTDQIVSLGICVKKEDEPLNYSTIAYLTEPSFNRFASFSWRATLPELKDDRTYGAGASFYARYRAAARREAYNDMYGDETIVYCLGAMCEEMEHDEAERYAQELLESADAADVDGSGREFIDYSLMYDGEGNLTATGKNIMAKQKSMAKAAALGQVVAPALGINLNEPEEEDWGDEDDDEEYKIIG